MCFLAIPCKSGRIGIPDLSLPPVTFIFPSNPTIEASASLPICRPSNGLTSLSFNSFVTDFPLISDTVNLKLAKYSKK